MDKLERLLEMQSELNDRIFENKDIRDGQGRRLTMRHLREEAARGGLGPNSDVNRWLRNYLEALDDEGRELREELLWKWWSKDALDMQNIAVEIIDQLHFWMSLALTIGLDADSVFDLYTQKNAVNFRRQKSGYSKKTKDEAENRAII